MKNIKNIFFFVSLILLMSISTISSGQFVGTDLTGYKKSIDVNFEYVGGFIMVDVMLSGVFPLKFIFDTGAQNTIIFDKSYTESLGYSYERSLEIMGSDLSSSVVAYVVRGVDLRLEGARNVKRDILVLDEDFIKLEQIVGHKVHGIVGSDFFRNMVVNINYKKGRINLTNPTDFNPKIVDDYQKIPITIENHKAYLSAKCNIDGQNNIPIKMLIDSGASLSCLINTDTDTLLKVPGNAIVGNLGEGLGGTIKGYVGKMSNLTFSEFQFPNIITYFHDDETTILADDFHQRNGILGNHLLARFNMTLDYLNETMYVKPERTYKKEFRYDKSGMTLYAYGRSLNEYRVKYIVEGSPAYEAGVREGDIIKKFGWLPARIYGMDSLNNKLSGKVGKGIKMVVARDGTKIPIKFKLKDLFDNTTTFQDLHLLKNLPALCLN